MPSELFSTPVFWKWLGSLCFAAYVTLHCLILGVSLFSLVRCWLRTSLEPPNAFLAVFLMSSVGLAFNLMFLFVLGLLGFLNVPAVTMLGIAPVLIWLARRQQLAKVEIFFSLTGLGLSNALIWALVLGLFALVLWPAGGAPGHWDDTMYHLPLARHYIQHGSLEIAPFLRFPLFPQHMNLLLVAGLLLGGDVLAQTLATLPLFLISLGLVGCGIWLAGSPLWGVVATVALLASPPVKSTWGFAYIDNGLALFCWAATVSMAISCGQTINDRQRIGWVGLSACLAGAAASTKIFGIVFAVLLSMQLWRFWRSGREILVYTLIFSVFGGVWYVRSYLISGDPIHPAGGNWFGFYLWDAGDLAGQVSEQATHGVGKEPWRLLHGLAKAGVAWWGLALVGLICFFRSAGPIRSFQIAFLTYFLFWFFVTQVDRYLAPVFAVGSFLSVLTIAIVLKRLASLDSGAKWLTWRPIWSEVQAVALVCWGLWMVAPKANDRMKHYSAQLTSRTGYSLMVRANSLIPLHGNRLVGVGFENAVYFFEGTVVGDWFGPGRYRQMIDCVKGPCQMVDPYLMQSIMTHFDSQILAVNTRRFPLDRQAYREVFDLYAENSDGILFVLKPNTKSDDAHRN